MIATLNDRESIHESRGVKLIPISRCIYYESILLQLVLTQNESRSLVIFLIVSIIPGPE